MRMEARQALAALVGVLLAGVARPAPESPVPLGIQAAIVKKLVAYDRALDGRPDLLVLVVHEASSLAQAEEAVRAFEQVGMKVEPCAAATAPSRLGDATIAFLVSPPSAAVQEAATKAGALTVSIDPGLAARGVVSVGLRRKADGRTEILINLNRARAERHDFSSYLLTIASIIK